MKVLLVCSSGGHLLQLYCLSKWWKKHERLWVTFKKNDAVSLLKDENVIWGYHPTTRNIYNLIRNFFLAIKIFYKTRPDVIVSNGAGIAFPFFLVAKLIRVKTVYIEVYDRVDMPSLTGRLCYPLTDLFVLQWEEQKDFYPKGVNVGRMI